MALKVTDLTVDELTQIIEDTLERKLFELLNDPDEGMSLRPEFEQRLRTSLKYVEDGGETISLEELSARLDKR